MICPRCGGEFSPKQNCLVCGSSYTEIINAIRHDELKNLFEKMDDLQLSHDGIEITESLLACELSNSSFLIPLTAENDQIAVMTVEDDKKRRYITLFTDYDAYQEYIKSIPPMTNPFWVIMDLLDERMEGFVINPNDEACEISRKFLNRYFKKENK